MKTARQYLQEWVCGLVTSDNEIMEFFKKVQDETLVEHNSQIISLIDEMIEDSGGRTDIEYDEYIGYKQALTELKEKIQSTN